MTEALFVLFISPFLAGGLIYLVVLAGNAIINAAGDFLGDE